MNAVDDAQAQFFGVCSRLARYALAGLSVPVELRERWHSTRAVYLAAVEAEVRESVDGDPTPPHGVVRPVLSEAVEWKPTPDDEGAA